MKSTNMKLSSSELSYFCMQIAMVLKSGMLISDGIDWMYDNIDEGVVKDTLFSLKEQLSNKIPLYSAMENSGHFPSYIVNMTQVGNITGKLEEVMTSLSQYYNRENYLKGKIKNIILYPSMLFVMMSLVIILLVTKIFPIFEGMVKELGSTRNNTSFLISFSSGIMAGKIAMALVITIMILLSLIFILNKTKNGKPKIIKFLNNFSLTKNIIKKITAYRFLSAMSLLMGSGMYVDASIEVLLDIVEEPLLKEKLQLSKDYINNGESFLSSLKKLSLFNSMHIQMLNMGEKTGELDVVMKRLTAIYEYEAEQVINDFVSLIEPALVCILSVVIGIILISVMLPLMNIMSSIG